MYNTLIIHFGEYGDFVLRQRFLTHHFRGFECVADGRLG